MLGSASSRVDGSASGSDSSNDAELAAHQLDDLSGDRQAEARAAEATRRRRIFLSKLLEDLRLAHRLDADARVDHFEAQTD
jgi:hypothetical protein